MPVDFVDSETCIIDGEKTICFKFPITLFLQIEKTLSEIGPKKFYSSPDEKIKKVRESLAECFFILALKKDSGKDWFLVQPEARFPDFVLMSAEDDPIRITLGQFELVEIPPRCKSFDEMFSIVQSKINKGYPKNYHLLIFLNNLKSKIWVEQLNQKLEQYKPFETIWIVRLESLKKNILQTSIVDKIRPYPLIHIEANITDKNLYKIKVASNLFEQIRKDGNTFLKIKPEIAKNIVKDLRKLKLINNKKSQQ